MSAPRVLILRTAGTNCDLETEHGFRLAGAKPDRVHINRLLERSVRLADYQALVIPGGFSYGDDLSAGKVLANELRLKLKDDLFAFAAAGRPVIGICNGFQVLVKTGLLPGFNAGGGRLTLTFNDSGHFEDRWVHLRCAGASPLLEGLRNETISLPVAHGEGKFLADGPETLERLKANGQVALQYATPEGEPTLEFPANPNGSEAAVAAVTNQAGNVLGMMPHPERFLFYYSHPRWTRGEGKSQDGLRLIRSFVRYAAAG
ncbi:MAG TPA: phosphoribosylformylglycinamidine synthase I [bacterium]|uniref:Phosphoribosylformylglycinamidine synthase subunit PurQ n=1 Tax=candidate division TA06 bacterium ADurb.Bin417 TaxID=1852828 RepID=A0A1V5MK38_UNCT6|nr:MAG: Phosphoribosylformylglycinamidine synthase 1 [candidate division TA06 bacterium ADurb.Bin417]HNQ34713.1 phosphoribosylformylglycinamidine synthase I [bacterium]HNS48647.1 phosphoribosylformylglycinamidine synthase I [bacterium]